MASNDNIDELIAQVKKLDLDEKAEKEDVKENKDEKNEKNDNKDEDDKVETLKLPSRDLIGISTLIKTKKIKKISLLIGAGISVSAGIPDFRSKNGLYNTLNVDKYTLNEYEKKVMKHDPHYLFSLWLFKSNPLPLLESLRDMYNPFKPTTFHWFIRLLNDKGLLKRLYSQNVDGLDHVIDIPLDKVMNVHGTLATASCINCKTNVDIKQVRAQILNNKIPIDCLKCNDKQGKGKVKPDVVLFGEALPERYANLLEQNDLGDVDLLIVAGTSLKVEPVADLVNKIDFNRCIRLVLNLDKITHKGFQYSRDLDLQVLGECDKLALELVNLLGWDKELEQLVQQFEQKTNNNDDKNSAEK